MSKAGELACAAHAYYGGAVADVMPALGTHAPMTPAQIAKMYPTIPPELFREHDWRHDTVTVGTVPAADVRELTNGAIGVYGHHTFVGSSSRRTLLGHSENVNKAPLARSL